VENGDLVGDQLHRARMYRNALVELELNRRAEVEALLDRAEPRLIDLRERASVLEAELEERRASIRRHNAARRSKDPDPPTVRVIGEIHSSLAQVRLELRAERKAAFDVPGVQEAMSRVDKGVNDRVKKLRADSGLFWGTYVAVEQTLRGIRSGAPPRFTGRHGPGKIAVQLQGGAAWSELLEGHAQCGVQILPPPPGALPGGRRSRRPRAILHIRVGSAGPRNRTPIWAEVPFVLHRTPPEDGRIKWVYVVRRRVGTHDQWSVQFVVTREEWNAEDTADARGAVALDMGWRTLEDGSIRVAYALDDQGRFEELLIPAGQVARWRKPDELQSIRDRQFAVARDRLAQWLTTADPPGWLREATETLSQWRRGQARLAGLVLRWRQNRFTGDEEIHNALEQWRGEEKRLFDWECFQRQGRLRWRDDHYRRFAASLRQRYRMVVVDDTDWNQLLATPPAEQDTSPLNTRYRARIDSPGLLRELIEESCEQVVRVTLPGSTGHCSSCGAPPARDWDRATERDYRCEAGHRLDQDRNAAQNRLRFARAEGLVE
jgi:hypothetical protein